MLKRLHKLINISEPESETKKLQCCYRSGCKNDCVKKKVCLVCKRVSYCSTSCRTLDSVDHRLLCSSSLSIRLQLLCQIRLDGCSIHQREQCINLSMCCMYGTRLLSPFEIYGDGCDQNRVFCAICGILIDKLCLKSLPPSIQTSRIVHKGKLWSYHRCSKCSDSCFWLCPTSLVCNYLCYTKSVTKLHQLWLLLSHMFTVEDVKRIIMAYLIRWECLCLVSWKSPGSF